MFHSRLPCFLGIADIRNPVNISGTEVSQLCQKNCPSLHVQAAENQSRQAANPQSFSAQTAAKSKSNATANAANSADSIDAQNADSKDHRRRIDMGWILVTYKVFPEDIVEDFEPLKAKIKAILPQASAIEGWGTEDVAFGLKALLVQIRFQRTRWAWLKSSSKHSQKSRV